jgi:hypothetical protein
MPTEWQTLCIQLPYRYPLCYTVYCVASRDARKQEASSMTVWHDGSEGERHATQQHLSSKPLSLHKRNAK